MGRARQPEPGRQHQEIDGAAKGRRASREDEVLELQRAAGNRATARMVQGHLAAAAPIAVQTWPWSKKKPATTASTTKAAGPTADGVGRAAEDAVSVVSPAAPYVIKIGSEQVRVSDGTEEMEARGIVSTIESAYGITLSSSATIKAIKAGYSKVSSAEKAKLKGGVWEMKELRALSAALQSFAPILGKRRESSTLAKKAQGVTTIGRLQGAIDENSKAGAIDDSTMGEYFGKKKNVGLFDAVSDLADDRYVRAGASGPDNATTLQANSIHEMAHGLIEPSQLAKWVSTLTFWSDRFTESGDLGAEEPPTEYGHSNSAEDLCESVAIYFVNRAHLLSVAPLRCAFLDAMVAGWTPPVKAVAVKKTLAATGSGS